MTQKSVQIKVAVIRFRNLNNLRDTSYNLRVDEGGVSNYNIVVFCDCACIGFRKKVTRNLIYSFNFINNNKSVKLMRVSLGV